MKKLLALLVIASLVFSTTACSKTNAAGDKVETVKGVEATITLGSGEIKVGSYTGDATAGVPNGEGVFDYANGQFEVWTYTGGFVNGQFEGQGKTLWDNGISTSIEEGMYKGGLLNGAGKRISNGILIEEGEFSNGYLNGPGKIFDDSGKLLYEGEFIQGTPNVESVGFNTPVIYADWEYFCTKTETHTSIGDYSTDEIYVVYLISAKNNSLGPRQLGDFFMVKDAIGRKYNMSTEVSLAYHFAFDTNNWYLDETGASLTSRDIPIVFEVPKDAIFLDLYPADAEYKGVAPISVQTTED
ncbi:MAG: hypothetical protein JJE03_07625 [Peptostreptococcaceae bacterium]|nr:hypothetical protein [Peptostreptococcaceae bacterium]